jgi:cation transport ATPase
VVAVISNGSVSSVAEEQAEPLDRTGNSPTQGDSTSHSGRAHADLVYGPGRGVTWPSVRVRFFVATFLVAVSLTAFLSVAAKPGDQPTNLIALICATLSAIVVAVEGLRLSAVPVLRRAPFAVLPFIGATAVCAAVFMATIAGEAHPITPLFAAAPALAAATLLIGSGLALRSLRVARSDDDFVFPRPISNRVSSLGQATECRAGDMITVDGRIQSGCVALDERRLSPISAFRIREEDEVVYAGSEVLAGNATVVALTTTNDASLHQLQSAVAPMVQEARQSLEVEDARASRWSALVILFLALSAGIFWHERTPGYTQALLAAGTVALFGSVCGVGLLLHGLRRGLVQSWMQRGYLLGTADSVKHLAAVRNVECDPSRCGEGSLLKAVSLDVLDDRLAPSALCDFVCALIGRAEDPVLAALAEYCRRHGRTPSVERVVELREYIGRGICGSVHGVELSVGTEDFLVERGIMIQPSDGAAPALGEHLVMVAIDDDVVARAHVIDGQASVLCADHSSIWAGDVQVSVAPGVARSLGDETLLVRGNESALVGQMATRDVTFFDPREGAIHRSTVVAFNPEIGPLEDLLMDCRTDVRTVDRVRLLVGFGGLMVLASVFAGAVTPLIPLLLVSFVGMVVHLSTRNLSTRNLFTYRN